MSVDAPLASSLQRISASRQAIETFQASLEITREAVGKSREAILKSKALLSMLEPRPLAPLKRERHEPRPQRLVSPEQEMERWRIATEIAQTLNEAGYGCQLSSPAQRAS